MLAIRLQRTGRKGRAHYRLVVQDSRQTPLSGKYVALLGSYDPHAKVANFAKDKAEFYLNNGAQPSERVAQLLKQEGVKLPKWVSLPEPRQGKTRNPGKLRRNQPAEAEAPAETAESAEAAEAAPADNQAEAPAAETTEEAATEETPAEDSAETAAEEAQPEAADEAAA